MEAVDGRGRDDGPRVLLVEDDRQLAGMLQSLLESQGYRVDVAADGQAGLHRGLTRHYDVLLIDRGLPVIEGVDLLSRLRARGIGTPALIVTARGALDDRVEGLDAGAEDYLVKPFELAELLARIRALLRRHEDNAEVLALGGDSYLDLRDRRVVDTPGGGSGIELSGRECALLRVLASWPSRTFTRRELLDRAFDEEATPGTVDTYVYYLRRKLGRGSIHTVHGLGYRLGVP